MQEPISIPIRDLGPTAGSPADASPATDRIVDLIVAGVLVVGSAAMAFVDDEEDGSSEELRRLGSAAGGFVIEGVRAAGALLGAVERAAGGSADAAERLPVLGPMLAHWRATWESTAGNEAEETASLQRTIDAVLDRLDLTTLVRSHLDVNTVASDVDVNALVGDLDVERLASRIDVAALADRIDVDGLAARLDIDAVLDRVDVVAIATDVIEQLDLAQLVREATQDTASDGVRAVRLRGVDADRAVRRAVDRLLARRDGEDAR